MLHAQRAGQALPAQHRYPWGCQQSASHCWTGLCFAEQQPVRDGSSGHVGLTRATHVMARQRSSEGKAP